MNFFKEKNYENKEEWTNGFFPISVCVPKDQSHEAEIDYKIYVSNKDCDTKPCSGSKENAFPNIISGLKKKFIKNAEKNIQEQTDNQK